MSDIENAARPTIERMMHAEGPSIELSPQLQRIIAAWATKTALMADFLARTPALPTVAYSRFFRDGGPPKDHIAVRTAAYMGPRPMFKSTISRLTIDASESFDSFGILVPVPAVYAGGTCTLRVWRAVFQVVFNEAPNAPVGHVSDGKVIHRIWPERRETLSWPPNRLALDDDGVKAFAGGQGTVRYYRDF